MNGRGSGWPFAVMPRLGLSTAERTEQIHEVVEISR